MARYIERPRHQRPVFLRKPFSSRRGITKHPILCRKWKDQSAMRAKANKVELLKDLIRTVLILSFISFSGLAFAQAPVGAPGTLSYETNLASTNQLGGASSAQSPFLGSVPAGKAT